LEATAASMIRHTSDEQTEFNSHDSGLIPSKAAWALFALLACIQVLHVVSLERWPITFVDEAWMAARAWGWLETGQNYGPLDAGVFEQLDGYWTFFPVSPTLIHAIATRLLGFSIISLRYTSYISGIALILSTCSISYLLSKSIIASALVGILISTSYAFGYSTHLARSDIHVATLGFTAIALCLASHPTKRWPFNLLAGLALGLAFEMHMNAIIYFPVVLALHFLQDGRGAVRSKRFWAFIVGTTAGAVVYLWLHVLRYPSTYAAMGAGLSRTHRPPILGADLAALGAELKDLGIYLFLATSGRLPIVLLAMIGLARKPHRWVRVALLLCGIGTIAFALLVRNKMDYYAILISPYTDIVLGLWVFDLFFSDSARTFWRKRCRSITLSWIAVTILLTPAIVTLTPPNAGVEHVAERIRYHLHPDDSIMASQVYWLSLKDYEYLSWQQILNYKQLNPGATLSEALNYLQPDVFVIDDHLALFIIDDIPAPPSGFARYSWERRLPEDELRAFLTCRGTLLDSFETAAYGNIMIYGINWHSEATLCQ